MAPSGLTQPSLRSSRRAHRAAYEHDDLDGLPVRQWREAWVKVAPTPQQEANSQDDPWTRELEMPKDTVLLPPHSQELLRLARSGRLYKRPAPIDDEDSYDASGPSTKTDEPENESSETSAYMTRVWKPVPRNIEDAPISYLSKRRKGTITIASKTIIEKPLGPTVTKATVRRLDAAGNPYTQEVALQPGQNVDGEIISTRQVVLVPASQIVETAAPEAAPVNRRRAPPPKRKPKGPGRGRKKKVVVEGAPADGSATASVTVPVNGSISKEGELSIKKEGFLNPDAPDQSIVGSDDENDDDDDGDDNEDGDDNDDSASQRAQQDTEMSDAQTPTDKTPEPSTCEPIASDSPDVKEESVPLAAVSTHLAVDPTPFEASPLRNVMTIVPSPAHSKPASPKAQSEATPAAAEDEQPTESKVEEPVAEKSPDEDVEMGEAESVEVPEVSGETDPKIETQETLREISAETIEAAEPEVPVVEVAFTQDEDIDMTEGPTQIKEESKSVEPTSIAEAASASAAEARQEKHSENEPELTSVSEAQEPEPIPADMLAEKIEETTATPNFLAVEEFIKEASAEVKEDIKQDASEEKPVVEADEKKPAQVVPTTELSCEDPVEEKPNEVVAEPAEGESKVEAVVESDPAEAREDNEEDKTETILEAALEAVPETETVLEEEKKEETEESKVHAVESTEATVEVKPEITPAAEASIEEEKKEE